MDPATILGALSVGKKIYDYFKGGSNSPKQQGISNLQDIANNGVDPMVLDRIYKILGYQVENQQNQVAGSLNARGIDENSSIGRAEKRAVLNSLPVLQGASKAGFNTASNAAQLSANQTLAGLPADNSGANLWAEIFNTGIDIYNKKKNPGGTGLTQSEKNMTKVSEKSVLNPIGLDEVKRYGSYV